MVTSRKKNQPKRNLSPVQKQRLMRIGIIMAACGVLWILFAPGAGVVSLWRKHNKLDELERENIELNEKITKLHSDIDKLQNDPEYLEDVARKKYKMLKKDEQVFDFNKPSKQKSQE